MNLIEDITITCPYCNENTIIMIDRSFKQQSYTEDCQICCQPIALEITIEDNHDIQVTPYQENN